MSKIIHKGVTKGLQMRTTTDITERLRTKPPVWEEMREAADEIDRLRRELKKANVQLHFIRRFNRKRDKGDL